jgi:hypothetical protein
VWVCTSVFILVWRSKFIWEVMSHQKLFLSTEFHCQPRYFLTLQIFYSTKITHSNSPLKSLIFLLKIPLSQSYIFIVCDARNLPKMLAQISPKFISQFLQSLNSKVERNFKSIGQTYLLHMYYILAREEDYSFPPLT